MIETAVIFGGSGDLGRVLTERLKMRGIKVLSSYNKKVTLKEGCFKYTAMGNYNENVFETLNKNEIKYLIFCIGIRSSKQKVEDTPTAEFLDLININALSFIEIYKAIVHNITRNNAHIVVVGSTASLDNKATNGAYSASKAYLTSIVETISKENYKVQIHMYNPSLFDSQLAREIVRMKGYRDFDKYVDENLGGKIKTTNEIASEIEKLIFNE